MKLPRLAVLIAGVAGLVGQLGCSSNHDDTAPDGEPASVGTACDQRPSPQRTEGTLLALRIQPTFEGNPFVFGQPNPLAAGGSLIPLNFRFYISEVELLRGDGTTAAVDLVTEDGTPEAYGVHLFNAEEDDSSTVRVLAPVGEYSGMTFALGIKLACNKQDPANMGDPLSVASQMTWPQTGGFLYLRYEGRLQGGSAGPGASAQSLRAVHMGGDLVNELVPRVTAHGSLAVPESGALEQELTVGMDEIFKGAASDIDVSDASVGFRSTPESVAGERLRRGLPELHVFELMP